MIGNESGRILRSWVNFKNWNIVLYISYQTKKFILKEISSRNCFIFHIFEFFGSTDWIFQLSIKNGAAQYFSSLNLTKKSMCFKCQLNSNSILGFSTQFNPTQQSQLNSKPILAQGNCSTQNWTQLRPTQLKRVDLSWIFLSWFDLGCQWKWISIRKIIKHNCQYEIFKKLICQLKLTLKNSTQFLTQIHVCSPQINSTQLTLTQL